MRRLAFVLLVAACARAQADTATTDLAPEVRRVVDTWLKAQNDGDFAAYSALYAERFTGVRRSGPRTVKLDRAGWLKDRQRMFAKKMTVTIADLKMNAAPTTARVTFQQTWASGTYQDVGEKSLVVVKEKGAARIVQEELLASRILGTDKPRESASEDALRWMVAGGVVVDDAPDESWGKGRPEADFGDPVVVRKKVDAKKLPDAQRAWLGRKIRGMTSAGEACTAQVTGFSLVGRVIPHFGTRQEWREKQEREAAAEAWSLSAKVLVGELAGCEKATWARAAALPVPALVQAEQADAAITAKALAAFRKLPEYQQIQKSYAESPEAGVKRWENFSKSEPTVLVLADVPVGNKRVTLVSVTATASESCGGFNGDLWAMWELRGNQLVPRNTPGTFTITPTAAADTDGDGTVELLFDSAVFGDFGTERGVVRGRSGLFDDLEKVEVPFMDCPC
jgi:ketosteroid isomerase-like protein